jgi:adenosylcobinamide-GDP ribazoletransferase
VKHLMTPNRFAEQTVRSLTAGGKELLGELLRCLRFYSRLPVPVLASELDPYGQPSFATMPRVVPLAGAVIGVAGALVLLAAHGLGFGTWLCALLAVAMLTLATGAFHEDGLADTADGFGGGATPERRLEIMKDSRIGTYGAAALILVYLLRIVCVAELLARLGPLGAMAALVLVGALSRTAALVLMTLLPPARTTGASYAAGQPEPAVVIVAWLICGVLGLAAGIASPLPWLGILLAFLFAAALALVATRLSARLIGGQTGDVGGAIQQLAEVAAYLGLLIAAGP